MKLNEKIKKHYKLGKKLSDEYNEVYGEIVLYLRGSKLTDLDAEDAIGDVLSILLEAQNRNASIEETLGNDIKQFCDNIVLSYGTGNRKTKFRESTQLLFIFIIVGTFWSYINIELPKVTRGFQSWVTFNFSLAMLLNIIVMAAASVVMLKLLIKPHFEKKKGEKKKNERADILLVFILFVIVIALLVVIGLFLRDIILFRTKLYWVILVIIVLFLLQKSMNPKSE